MRQWAEENQRVLGKWLMRHYSRGQWGSGEAVELMLVMQRDRGQLSRLPVICLSTSQMIADDVTYKCLWGSARRIAGSWYHLPSATLQALEDTVDQQRKSWKDSDLHWAQNTTDHLETWHGPLLAKGSAWVGEWSVCPWSPPAALWIWEQGSVWYIEVDLDRLKEQIKTNYR